MTKLRIFPHEKEIDVIPGTQLLSALRAQRIVVDAPCAGNGKCGKCRVLVDGVEVLACRQPVDRDMTVVIPGSPELRTLQGIVCDGNSINPAREGYLVAADIGTTSLVCFLLDGKSGEQIGHCSMINPQIAFGADVISRIQAALAGALEQEGRAIRGAMEDMIRKLCADAKILPGEIGLVAVVGNPAMQQLFLGISPENLAEVPFAPVLTEAKIVPCADLLPLCADAGLLIVPDISGYIGADTMGCVLSAKLHEAEEVTLMVDIGTNGEMVLGDRNRLVACAAAAGPALEGANIQFGMRGTDGAIDHIWLEKGRITYSVIGGGEAVGICGSGLIDAVAVGLEMGLLNRRGRILNETHTFYITDHIYLTQDDIRQVQLSKGAICAGIQLMARQLGLQVNEIRKVLLAGAFGSYMNPKSACRIGLLPEELLARIETVGNAAGSGAKMLACDRALLPLTQELAGKIEFLELAGMKDFPGTFARAMNFREERL